MSFTPEILSEIYLNGVLTDEAQKVFNEWMEKDPLFSQKIIADLKNNLGEKPESLAIVETRLDTQMETVWNQNKPSASLLFLKKNAQKLAVVLLTVLLGWAFIHWADQVQKGFRSAFQMAGVHLPEIPISAPPKLASRSSTLIPPMMKPLTAKEKANLRKQIKALDPHQHLVQNDVTYRFVNHILQITVDIDKNQRVVISLLNQKSHLICSIYQGPMMAGHHVISWSGKDNMSNPVLPGKYNIVVQANGQTTSGMIQFPDF